MRVCHIVPSLEDRHGGPSKSVRALANSLAQQGEEVDLLSTAEPGQLVPFAGGDQATVRLFARVAPRWLTCSPELRHQLQTGAYDCFHNHSLWLLPLRYAYEAARRSDRPLVISPRGMMSGWAYRHRRWRKFLAECLVHPRAFAGTSGWHATSPAEADDIRRLGFKQPVCVSPNGVALPDATELSAARAAWHKLYPAARQRPVAVFYSRFHRKKRLRELIDLWLSTPRGDWLLLIAGVEEEFTANGLNAMIARAGGQDRIVAFAGVGRPPPYAVASLFVLPSHSENFGLVIAEALAAGVPALVTDTTPWQGLTAQECGWCVPWESFGATLGNVLARPRHELEAMGTHGRNWVDREYSWERAARLLQDFYRHLQDEQR